MSIFSQLSSVWKNIKEFELAPIRDEALDEVMISIVGAPSQGRDALAEQMHRDPRRHTQDQDSTFQDEAPLQILSLENASQAESAELILLVLSEAKEDLAAEQTLSRQWSAQGKKVLVFYHNSDPDQAQAALRQWAPWNASAVLSGSAQDPDKLLSGFVPAVLKLLPERHLALGRQFPLFRQPIARQLINDTSYTNAAYALTTGIAEVVPVLNVPLNVTDMIVLTKAQAFLTYRLGLLLGFSTTWQDYLAEFGSVIGGGFVWRQLARSLVGLIPVWGIIPKVAVAYAGTYLVGHTILQWYVTGRHLDPRQARRLYSQALNHGKEVAKRMLGRLPKPHLRLPAGKKKSASQPEMEILLPDPGPQTCPECGQRSASDAQFCQYCGHPLTPVPAG